MQAPNEKKNNAKVIKGYLSEEVIPDTFLRFSSAAIFASYENLSYCFLSLIPLKEGQESMQAQRQQQQHKLSGAKHTH